MTETTNIKNIPDGTVENNTVIEFEEKIAIFLLISFYVLTLISETWDVHYNVLLKKIFAVIRGGLLTGVLYFCLKRIKFDLICMSTLGVLFVWLIIFHTQFYFEFLFASLLGMYFACNYSIAQVFFRILTNVYFFLATFIFILAKFGIIKNNGLYASDTVFRYCFGFYLANCLSIICVSCMALAFLFKKKFIFFLFPILQLLTYSEHRSLTGTMISILFLIFYFFKSFFSIKKLKFLIVFLYWCGGFLLFLGNLEKYLDKVYGIDLDRLLSLRVTYINRVRFEVEKSFFSFLFGGVDTMIDPGWINFISHFGYVNFVLFGIFFTYVVMYCIHKGNENFCAVLLFFLLTNMSEYLFTINYPIFVLSLFIIFRMYMNKSSFDQPRLT